MADPASRSTASGWHLITAILVAAVIGLREWQAYTRPGPAHLRQGMDLLAAQRLPEAEEEWLQGAKEDPRFPDCYVQLGDLYMQEKRYSEAVTNYTTASNLTPKDGSLFLRLNRAEFAIGDSKAAMAAIKRAAELRPDDPDAVGLYGLFLGKQDPNQQPTALAALQQAHRMKPTDPDYLKEMVRLEISLNALTQAEQDLSPYLQAHPDDAWACHLMGVIDEKKPDSLQAALDYELRARAGLPNDLRIYVTLGNIYRDLNRFQDAVEVYRAGLRIDPNTVEMLQGLTASYKRLGNAQQTEIAAARLHQVTQRHESITHLQDLLTLNHNDISSGLELAHLEEQDGNDTAAHGVYVQMLHQAPTDMRTHRALADFYRKHGNPDLAAKAMQPDYLP